MTYYSKWFGMYAAGKMAVAGALVAGVVGFSAPAQALTISGFGITPNTTEFLSLGDVFAAEVRGDAGDPGGSFYLGFEATEHLVAVETNTFNPLTGFVDPFIEWNTASDGSGTTLASLNTTQLTAGGLTTMVLNFLPGDTRFLIISWGGILKNHSNWDVRVEAIPLPAGLLLFLSGLAGIGFLGRYKARRREPAAA
jgi:hypothetical protein